MTSMRLAVLASATLALLLSASGATRADLIVNGGFESYSTGLNGPGNLTNYTTITDWSVPATNSSSGTAYPNNDFLFTPGSADTTGSYYPYISTYYKLWGPNNGSANGLPATSPAGGNFLGLDADSIYSGAVSQTVTGLTPGQSYTLSFDWAGAQLSNAGGMTTEMLQVSFGSQTQFTPVVNNKDHGFTGWTTQTMTFTADGTSDTLSFLAVGTPNGLPPFVLLDGVSLNPAVAGAAGVPEPGTLLLVSACLVGLGMIRRLRKRGVSATV